MMMLGPLWVGANENHSKGLTPKEGGGGGWRKEHK